MSSNLYGRLGLDHRVLFILAAALILRLAYGLTLPDSLFHADAQAFDSLAWNLAEHGQYGVGQPTAVRPPAYVFFLAAIYKIAGHSYAAARVAQAFMGTLMVWVLMRLSRRLSNRPALPFVTGLFSAFYPFFIYYENQLLSEALLTFGVVLSLFLFVRWKEKPLSLGRAGACGLAFALVTLTKIPMIVWTLFVLLAELMLLWRLSDRSARLMRVLAAAVVFSLPLGIWSVRNKAALGTFSLDNHGGFTLVSTIIYHAQTKAGTFGDVVRQDPFFLDSAGWPEAERERYYYDSTLRFIKEHPKRYFTECLTRCKDFWRFYPRPDVRFQEGTSRLIVLSLLTEPFLIVAGLITLFLLRPAWSLSYPASGAIVWLTLLHSLITGQMRYRLPLMPLLILGAAYLITLRNKPETNN